MNTSKFETHVVTSLRAQTVSVASNPVSWILP